MRYKRLYASQKDQVAGVRADQIVVLLNPKSKQDYPEKLRRYSYVDRELGKRLVFLTKNFTVSATVVADIYKLRWQVELFFMWIKSHLRIKSFYGTSINAVKSRIWVALSIYLLVVITHKVLDIRCPLYTFSRTD